MSIPDAFDYNASDGDSKLDGAGKFVCYYLYQYYNINCTIYIRCILMWRGRGLRQKSHIHNLLMKNIIMLSSYPTVNSNYSNYKNCKYHVNNVDVTNGQLSDYLKND